MEPKEEKQILLQIAVTILLFQEGCVFDRLLRLLV